MTLQIFFPDLHSNLNRLYAKLFLPSKLSAVTALHHPRGESSAAGY